MSPSLSDTQRNVVKWLETAFPGSSGNMDRRTRALRLLEEAVELAQAVGITRENAFRQVEHTFSRPVGEPHQELGGVLFTALAVAASLGLDAHQVVTNESERAWDRIPEIREKNRSKVKVDA